MKKVISVIIVFVILLVAGAAVTGIVVDNMTSQNIENELKSIELPLNTTIEDSVSRTGKLTGPSSSLEYYGAVLLKSTYPLASLNSHYKAAYKGDLDIKIISLRDAPDCMDFGADFAPELRFSHHDASPEGYYMVYAFGEGQDPFPMLDYRSYF